VRRDPVTRRRGVELDDPQGTAHDPAELAQHGAAVADATRTTFPSSCFGNQQEAV